MMTRRSLRRFLSVQQQHHSLVAAEQNVPAYAVRGLDCQMTPFPGVEC